MLQPDCMAVLHGCRLPWGGFDRITTPCECGETSCGPNSPPVIGLGAALGLHALRDKLGHGC